MKQLILQIHKYLSIVCIVTTVASFISGFIFLIADIRYITDSPIWLRLLIVFTDSYSLSFILTNLSRDNDQR